MKKENKVQKVLRVGVANNFNFTKKEIEAVGKLDWPQDKIFVNSNSFVTVTNDYPSFLTINPYLDSWQEPKGELDKVKACRIKYIADARENVKAAFEEALHWTIENGIAPLITFMRFCSKASMATFVNPGGELNYSFRASYYRLTAEALENSVSVINKMVSDMGGDSTLLHFCDLAGEGCPSCGNCAKLAMGITNGAYELHGINLEESGDAGDCLFHCPDCWAKKIATFRKPVYGKIVQNSKQKGYEHK